MRAGGIVLCGGRSSRMGRPKAWLPVGDEVFLQRVVRIVREAVDPVVVVAAPGQDVPGLPADVRIVRDDREHLGPLNGLLAGLDALAGSADAAYLSACDVPLLRPAFVRRVVDQLGDLDMVIPEAAGLAQPLAGCYRVAVRDRVRAMLAEGQSRLLELAVGTDCRFLDAAVFEDIDPHLESLRNVNTEEEYRAVLARPGK